MASDPLTGGKGSNSVELTSPTEPYSSITPTTTSTANDEKPVPVPISIELKRNSSVSPPATIHPSTPYDTDIEATTTQQSSDRLKRGSTAGMNTNCSVWPGQDHWKQKARAANINNRSCQCFARLSKRARIAVKIAILLLIVGIAIGVGFGVSKPLGAGIWKPDDH